MSTATHPLHDTWRDLERRFEAACARSRAQSIAELNQLLRRLRQYKGEKEWTHLVLEGAAMFARCAALFSIDGGGKATLLGQRDLDLPESLSFPCGNALAFEAARASADGIIALRTPSEVTEALSDSDSDSRANLFPISNATRVVAILFVAADPETDSRGLELIAGLASCALERQNSTPQHAQITPAPAAPKPSLPVWAGIEESQRLLHIRARRFARVTVAEMQLAKPEACRAGREQRDLYLFLTNEIEKAREIYKRQFGTISPMADYLHLELVRTAAEGDEMKLGADYPGQLV